MWDAAVTSSVSQWTQYSLNVEPTNPSQNATSALYSSASPDVLPRGSPPLSRNRLTLVDTASAPLITQQERPLPNRETAEPDILSLVQKEMFDEIDQDQAELDDAWSPAHHPRTPNSLNRAGMWSTSETSLPAPPPAFPSTPPGRVQNAAHAALKTSPTRHDRVGGHTASMVLEWGTRELSTILTAQPYQPQSTQERPPQAPPPESSPPQVGQRFPQDATDPGQMQPRFIPGSLAGAIGQGPPPPIFPHLMFYAPTTGAPHVQAPGTFVFQTNPFAWTSMPIWGHPGSPQAWQPQGFWQALAPARHPMQGGMVLGPWNSPPPMMQPCYALRQPEQTYVPDPSAVKWPPAPGECPPPGYGGDQGETETRADSQASKQQPTQEIAAPQPQQPSSNSSVWPLPKVQTPPPARWPRGEALQVPSPTQQLFKPFHMTQSPTSSLGSSDPRMSLPETSTARHTSQETSPTTRSSNASPSSSRDGSSWTGLILDSFREVAGECVACESAATRLQQCLCQLFGQLNRGIKVGHTAWGLLRISPTQFSEFDRLKSCAAATLQSSLPLIEALGFRVLQTPQADHIQLRISRRSPTKTLK